MNDFLALASALLSNGWRLLTSVTFPGLGVPVAYVLLAVFLMDLSLRILSFILGFTIFGISKNEEAQTGRSRPHLPSPHHDRLPPH